MPELFSDTYFMKLALQEAQQAARCGEIPIGAVIVCQNQVIAKAHNQTELLNDVTAHAEMIAITAATNLLGGKYLKDCTMYVTIEPCVMCAGALGWAQIGKIVYGAAEEKKGFTCFAPRGLHPKTVVTKGVLEKECAELMRAFFATKRK